MDIFFQSQYQLKQQLIPIGNLVGAKSFRKKKFKSEDRKHA